MLSRWQKDCTFNILTRWAFVPLITVCLSERLRTNFLTSDFYPKVMIALNNQLRPMDYTFQINMRGVCLGGGCLACVNVYKKECTVCLNYVYYM